VIAAVQPTLDLDLLSNVPLQFVRITGQPIAAAT
jgi:hypothetical protein